MPAQKVVAAEKAVSLASTDIASVAILPSEDEIIANGKADGKEIKLPLPPFGTVELLAPWFPKVIEDETHAITFRTKRKRRYVVLWTCFTLTVTAFSTNLILTLLAWTGLETTVSGVATIFHGDCTLVARYDTVFHVLINVLSTLLLGASNLSLQLVVAPTREEVDAAHAKGIWLDIGVPSFRNLRHISRTNLFIWICLVLSSVPIHFLYNSVVFSSSTSNVSSWVVAHESFLSSGHWDNDTLNGYSTIQNGSLEWEQSVAVGSSFSAVSYIHNNYINNSTVYANVSNYECIMRSMNPLEWRPNTILISSDPVNTTGKFDANSSILAYGQNSMKEPGIFDGLHSDGLCNYTSLPCQNFSSSPPSIADKWNFKGASIQYCLVETGGAIKDLTEQCYLQCTPSIMLVVTCCNAVKCICILFIIRSRFRSLCVLGDAIHSFLRKPDPFTEHLGAVSKNFINHNESWNENTIQNTVWQPQDIRWFRAASIRRWMFTLIAVLLVLLAALVLIIEGVKGIGEYGPGTSISDLWGLGFGVPNLVEIISWNQPATPFQNIIIANIWQVLISYLYLALNSILSCIMIADEWRGFSMERKTLRVSAPVGIQRSSYFISMPLRYSLPIMGLFAIEHWLLSQATFVVGIVLQDWDIYNTAHTYVTTAGFSIMPCIFALLLGFLVPLALVAFGSLKNFPAESAMPLVVSCSAAISANCHRPDQDIDAWRLPVRWGVIDTDETGAKLCSFTTLRDVELPGLREIVRGRDDPKREHWRMVFLLRRCWRTVGHLWRKNIKGVQLMDPGRGRRKAV